jgi:hypothetical protein
MSEEEQSGIQVSVDETGVRAHVWVGPGVVLTFVLSRETLDLICAEWPKYRDQTSQQQESI